MRTLRGILPGQTATLQVRVWDITRFPTYALSECLGQWGRSSLFDYTVPPDGSPSEAYFMENLRGFFLFIYDYWGPAPGMVNFNNNVPFVTRADRLVRDGPGAPLVGTNFVAQLYYGPTSTDLRPHPDAPAKFRPPTTTAPGTWSGGTRLLPGCYSGDTAWLQVRVWDWVQFPTYEGAVAGGGVHAMSCPFTYTIPSAGAAPSEFFMENFPGIPGPLDCSAGWFSWGTSDDPPSGNRFLVLAHVSAVVWRATNLNQPSWQLMNYPATLRIPMTNDAQFFKVERVSPPLP